MMDLIIQPSLQYSAMLKLVFTVYNADIINFIKEMTLEEDYEGYDYLDVDIKEEKWIRKTQQKARIFINNRLPKKYEEVVIHMLYPIVSEIRYWLRDHFHIIKHIEKNQYKNILRWTSGVTIDRARTAEQFVRSESIDKRVRFLMACIYFRESDVLELWIGMTADERQTIFYTDTNLAVQFWIDWLSEGALFPWTECISGYLDLLSPRHMFPEGSSRIRVSSFFTELKPHNQEKFIYICIVKRVHSDDLLRCYNLMDEAERTEIIPTVLKPIELLRCYLDWPFQKIFLAAVRQLEHCLTRYCYGHCLQNIVYKKLMRGVKDFNYLQLLKDLWKQIPDTQKEEIQRQRIFPAIQAAMSYNEEIQHLPIEKILKLYLPSVPNVY